MTLVKFKKPNTLFPALMDDFWRDFPNLETASFMPSANIKEEDGRYWLELSVPGYDKNHIQLTVENDVLTVSGNAQEEKEESANGYLSREFRTGSFKRSFNLNKLVDTEKVSATYENGILRIDLPKVETAVRKTREIKVG